MFKYNLGDILKDSISGFIGVCTARIEFLNGCLRYQLSPKKLKNEKIIECVWFDEQQIELKNKPKKKNKTSKVGGDYPNPPSLDPKL